jgi:sulfur carrier protein
MGRCFHEAATPTSRAELRRCSKARDTVCMDIELNGRPCNIREGASLQELLQEQGLAGRRVAIEVNGEIVPRGRHASHVLGPGDRVEVVHALGGG